jgi:hypothetical protein
VETMRPKCLGELARREALLRDAGLEALLPGHAKRSFAIAFPSGAWERGDAETRRRGGEENEETTRTSVYPAPSASGPPRDLPSVSLRCIRQHVKSLLDEVPVEGKGVPYR